MQLSDSFDDLYVYTDQIGLHPVPITIIKNN